MVNQLNQRSNRDYQIQKWDNCRKNLSARVQGSFSNKNINKISFDGSFDLSEDINGDLVFVFESHKCSLDLKTCQPNNRRNFYGICEVFEGMKTFGFKNAFTNVKPPLHCHPLTSRTYLISNATVDLSIISSLPLDGYIWLLSLKFVDKNKKGTSSKPVVCMNIEMKVVKSRKVE